MKTEEAAVAAALHAAHERIAERALNTAEGMRATARELRKNAKTTPSSADSDAMLRIAIGYETRAADVEKRQRRPA